MMETQSNAHLNMLIQALQLLAAHYEQQVNTLPTFVVADEVALTFDDAFLLTDPLVEEELITVDQQKELRQLDTLLEQMSDDKNVWTLTALETAPEWEQVRQVAEQILSSFRMQKQVPDLSWVQYVPGKRESKTEE